MQDRVDTRDFDLMLFVRVCAFEVQRRDGTGERARVRRQRTGNAPRHQGVQTFIDKGSVIGGVITGGESFFAIRASSDGDLTAEVPHRGEKTEIGAMADVLQVFKEALIAKKAADEAAARDAEAKIERGRRVDAITRKFETMIGEVVGTVSSASTELEASASTLTNTAQRGQELRGQRAVERPVVPGHAEVHHRADRD